MAEELIGGFASPNMARGALRGYELYVTTDRIIGVKGGWREFASAFGEIVGAAGAGVAGGIGFGAALGAGVVARDAVKALGAGVVARDAVKAPSVDGAKQAIEQLEQKKDFEARKDELKEVRIQRKKGWLKRTFTWWGDLTIETTNAAYGIRLIKGDTGEVEMLKDMFTAFDKEKLLVENR